MSHFALPAFLLMNLLCGSIAAAKQSRETVARISSEYQYVALPVPSGLLGSTEPSAQDDAVPVPSNSDAAVPPPETLLALIRTYILALDHARRTGNFSVLYAMSGPALRGKLSLDRFGEAFANLNAQPPDLVVIAIGTPKLIDRPAIVSEGLLRLVGIFATRLHQVLFEFHFETVAGEWQLAGMRVSVAPNSAR